MFDTLRNKEQLGYYVSCSMRNSRGVLGFMFLIQSAAHDPVYLEKRIHGFIDEFYTSGLTESAVNEFKTGLIARKKAGFRDLKEEYTSLYGSFRAFSLA